MEKVHVSINTTNGIEESDGTESFAVGKIRTIVVASQLRQAILKTTKLLVVKTLTVKTPSFNKCWWLLKRRHFFSERDRER